MGSRVRVEGKWPLQRKIVSYGATFLGKISLLLRDKYYLSYDILSGFLGAETELWRKVAFNKENIGKFRLRGYKLLFDFLKVLPKNTDFGEIYYKFHSREGGSSKVNLKIYLEYFKSLLIKIE